MRLALAVAALVVAAQSARADECSELWFSRNRIYKSAGYCFKSSRALEVFGNAGCQYDDMRDVPLSESDRVAVGRYVREEAVLGCRL